MMNQSWLSHYQLTRQHGGWLTRTDRGLIEVSGPDRAAWLNNLVTNVIKTLGPGDGNYAFAVNIKGRVVFDLNMLVLDDPAKPDGRLWLDIDHGWVDAAMKHLNKYIITENVTLVDRSPRVARYAWLGPRAAAIVERIGGGNQTAMAALQHVALGEHGDVRLIRHDFAGLPGAELIVSIDALAEWKARLQSAFDAEAMVNVEPEVVDVLRIEAGIPASRRDIDAEVVPPETGQVERGISYHKGCYLGQEVIERMRSHGVLPRKLVGLRLTGGTGAAPVNGPQPPPAATDDIPSPPMLLQRDSNEVGRVTSTCWSPALGSVLALGYVKSAHITPGVKLVALGGAGKSFDAEWVTLPVA